VAYLLDVDHTLFDNSVVVAEIRRRLLDAVGAEGEQRYWAIFEALFADPGFADYLGAFNRLSAERERDPGLLNVPLGLLEHPFADRLYPRALDVIAALRRRGPVVIVSDGDIVFQPHKIKRSGLWDAVEGRVLVYVHKEQMITDIERRCPAQRYVMVDDKIYLLAAMKAIWGDRVRTVFVRQGRYALDAALVAKSPPADLAIDAIGEILDRLDEL
jgi:FMN phosphatase YigB (HAD superfamily)